MDDLTEDELREKYGTPPDYDNKDCYMDDITIRKEDLSNHDTGGGIRRVTAEITIDSSQSPEMQQRAVVYEVLAAHLDIIITHDNILYLSSAVCDALNEL